MAAPPEWAELLRSQCSYRGGVSVTSCLGCPRKAALLRDGAPVQLDRVENRVLGTGLHRMFETIEPATAEVRVAGTLFGGPIRGRIDRVRDGLVCDYKLKLTQKRAPDGPYPEETWQAECYRNLLAQNDIQTTGWVIYYYWGGQWFDFSHSGPILSEDELGRFRPHGSQWTTAELAGLFRDVDRGARAESLPLVGEAFKMGSQTSCNWCEVEDACKGLGGEVEF